MIADNHGLLGRFRIAAEGLDHPECVVWDPRGWLYAGGEAGQIYRVELDGSWQQVAETNGVPLGIALDAVGRLYVCDMGRSQVVRVDASTGRTETYSSGTSARPMRVPNYPAFGPNGSLYVTDSGDWDIGNGCIYRVEPGGESEVWLTGLDRFPNGCALSIAGDALLVVESNRPGLWRIPIRNGGKAGEPIRECELPGTVPDGLAVGAGGEVYISCYRPDQIMRVDLGGSAEIVVEDPRGTVLAMPTNVAFYGPDLAGVAVANLGRRYLTFGDIGARGIPLRYPRIA